MSALPVSSLSASKSPSQTTSSDSQTDEVSPVKEVESIAVAVEVEPSEASSEDNREAGGYTSLPANSQLAEAIKQVLQDQWSVEPGIVSIRERQREGTTGQ